MNKLFWIAAGAAALMGAGAAQAHEGGYYGRGYLPPPPYAYGPAPAYLAHEHDGDGDCDHGFTLAGAHAKVEVLGFSLGAGSSFKVGDFGCHRHHHHHHRAAYAPEAYGPPEGPPAYRYAYPVPPEPCCERPRGW